MPQPEVWEMLIQHSACGSSTVGGPCSPSPQPGHGLRPRRIRSGAVSSRPARTRRTAARLPANSAAPAGVRMRSRRRLSESSRRARSAARTVVAPRHHHTVTRPARSGRPDVHWLIRH
ncbi:hypothetical protein ACR6C2_37965 [Streptomyces sp. INA 01156]